MGFGEIEALGQDVRMAMIGGGSGAFIGPVHRMAAALDGRVRLVAGCFSSDDVRNRQAGMALGVDADRTYATYAELIDGEARRPVSERAEFIAIVTPNHLHAPAALAALAGGFPVLCEKPLARDLAEARTIDAAARAAKLPFAVTYTYLGYPLVREARAIVAAGRLGAIRRVSASYTQGWLADAIEDDGNKQAAWRTDPALAGAGGAMGDIGVHAHNLIEFVSGEKIASVSADIRTTIAGRRLDDDGAVLLRLANGARGVLVASQVCAGDENRLELTIHGEKGSLRWAQETPAELWFHPADEPSQRITANPAILRDPGARALLRLPSGHPEGYIEAFANLYRAFAATVRGEPAIDLPTTTDGLRGLAFVEAVVASSAADGAWHPIAA